MRNWLHRITAPPLSPAKPTPIPEERIIEDIAPHRSYADSLTTEPEADADSTRMTVEDEVNNPANDLLFDEATPSEAQDVADEDYLRFMSERVDTDSSQPGEVDAKDFLVLLSVFSKKQHATAKEIAMARQAMRSISGSEIEQSILDQLNGKDGYVAVMLEVLTKDSVEKDDPPVQENKSDRTFRLEDYL